MLELVNICRRLRPKRVGNGMDYNGLLIGIYIAVFRVYALFPLNVLFVLNSNAK